MSKKAKHTELNESQVNTVPLAIVGIGCLFPKANDPRQYWTNIREGVDTITEIPATHWNPRDYFDPDKDVPDMTYARRGGFIDTVEFDPLLYGLSPNNIEATDTTQLLGMVVARQALLDAGYATARDAEDGRPFNRDRTCVILGVTGTLELVIPLGARLGHPIWRKALADAGVDKDTAEDVVQRIAAGYVPWQENSFPGLLGNVAAGRIANRFDLGGTNCVVDAACASSLSAIHMAALELYSGKADMAITGGFDTFNDIFMYMCFSKTPALSPTGNSKPFDHEGDGTILGEGLGAIILKRLDDARRDKDHIYAVIKGIGSSSDGRGNAIYAPSAEGQTRALKSAYTAAGVSPRTIELVEAHGTGTRVGDAVEADALSGVYREDQEQGTWCAIGSVKSMIGHTKAAAGVAGLIKIAMALRNKVLPPTIKVEQPLEILEPGKAPVYINTIKRPWIANDAHPRRAALSAFGFGGSNFHCVLEEAEQAKPGIEWDGNVILYSMSDDSVERLLNKLEHINSELPRMQLRAEAVRSNREFNQQDKYRLVLVIDENTDVNKLVSGASHMLQSGSEDTAWHTPDGAYFGCGDVPGKLAVLFPGQGSQYCDMLMDLACQFPQLQDALYAMNHCFQDVHDRRLSDCIYPVPVFNADARLRDEENLRSTVNAQPAIGVISQGAFEILKYFSITPDVTAGHSFGELSALCAANVIGAEDFYRLAIKRGELMQAGSDDNGSMLAVSASAAVIHEFLEAEQLDLIIANNNAPKQVVLSGSSDQIQQAEELLGKRGLQAKQLKVAAAFHSSYVADAEKPLSDFLSSIKFKPGNIPVYANTTAEVYPDAPASMKTLLAGQLAQPVEFVAQVENMYSAGVQTFIEVGPGNTLTTLAGSILKDKPHHAFALDASKGKRGGQGDLAIMLARLAVLGHRVDIQAWDGDFPEDYAKQQNEKPAMSVPVSGANYVRPRPERAPVVVRKQADKVQPADTRSITPVRQNIAPPGQAVAVTGNTGEIADALKITQQSILALQKMQEQTANLHKQYLEGQETAQKNIQQLIQQQQNLLTGNIQSHPGLVPEEYLKTTGEVQAAPAEANAKGEVLPDFAPAVRQPAEDDALESLLLEVVADKTGYPVEMLSMDMSLDTDLGIDSIKRVEILSALQEKLPGVQKVQPEDLGTFQLLKHIVEFLAADNTVVSQAVETNTPSAQNNDNELRQALLEVVGDKTGYPVDMLNLGMNLDTDLGIDSIKRVEILSAFQERMPGAPAVNPEDLAALQTLQQIVDFMHGQEAPRPAAAEQKSAGLPDARLQSVLLEVVADKTGYPVDMLNPGMNLDTDLGIDSIKRVEILSAFQERMPGAPAVNPEDLAALQTLQQIVEHMQIGETSETVPVTDTDTEKVNEQAVIYRSELELSAIGNRERQKLTPAANTSIIIIDDGTDLPARLCEEFTRKNLQAQVVPLDAKLNENVSCLLIPAPENGDMDFVYSAFKLVQQAGKSLTETAKGGDVILAGLTRLGGAFGIQDLSTANPVTAGLAGIIKTADKEWPHVHCKSIDIPAGECNADLVTSIADEFLTKGPLETGINSNGLCTLTLNTRLQKESVKAQAPLVSGELLVVSGGARGVTAEVTLSIAQNWQTNLLLLGRSPEPAPEPGWLSVLADEKQIKDAIISRDDGLSVKQVQEKYQRILADREILNNLKRIRDTGVDVIYSAVDIRDPESVSRSIDTARQKFGPVKGVIHGAGVIADRLIEDKTEQQYRQVVSTKVDGINAILHATREDELKLLVMFSSSTGRFGRKGQVDYAVANEMLNKIAQHEQTSRPACRVLSLNWGPWDGGMVTPQLKKIFEREGVSVIPVRAGCDFLIREASASGPVEIVVLGSEPEDTAAQYLDENPEQQDLHPVFEMELNIDDYPVLASHVMNGRAVLPAALVIEWLAHAAMHNNPGLKFKGFDNFKILKGVIIEPEETINIKLYSSNCVTAGDDFNVRVELRSNDRLNAAASIVLGMDYDTAYQAGLQSVSGDYPFTNREFYANGQLFHGTDLQGIKCIHACSESGISGEVNNAPAPGQWMKTPIRSGWISDPLVLDTCFQMMILWSFHNTGKGSLPTAIGSYRQYQASFPGEKSKVDIFVKNTSGHASTANIEIRDENGSPVAVLRDYQCVIDTSLNDAFTRNRLVTQE